MIEGLCEILFWIVAVCTVVTGIVTSCFSVPLWITIISVIVLALLAGFIFSIAVELLFDKQWGGVLFATGIMAFIVAGIALILTVIVRVIM